MTNGALTDILNDLRGRSPEFERFLDVFVDRLSQLRVGARAPKRGEPLPNFTLPDQRGRHRSLSSLLKSGPLVLSFQRGAWCPYCVAELESWHDALPELSEAGGRLALVSAEIRGRSQTLADIVGPGTIALCDIDHGIALGLGLAFHVGPDMLDHFREFTIDLNALYGGSAGLLPVPATYVIGTDGIVDYAFVDPDFRTRAEPAEVVRAVAALPR